MVRTRRVLRWVQFVIFVALIGAGMPRQVAALPGSVQTPAAGGATPGSLADMLGHLGDLPFGHDSAMVTYADLAGQAAALRVVPPADADDLDRAQAWISAILPLPLPQSTASHWFSPEWRRAFGFDLYQVAQAVEYADVPFSLTVLRGSFDPDELRAAWGRTGYQKLDLGAGEAYAIRPDAEVDLSTAAGRMALGHLNVVAIADDGSLILGSTRDGVREALAATAGSSPSLAARAELAPLVRAAPLDLVSAVIVPGSLLRASGDMVEAILGEASPEAVATRVAAELTEAARMPQVVAALFGQTAGLVPGSQHEMPTATPAPVAAGPAATLVAILRFLSPEQATEAAEVVADRLATQRIPAIGSGALDNRPWAEIFPERAVRAVPAEPAVLIELHPAAEVPSFILLNLVYRRTPGFLAWG